MSFVGCEYLKLTKTQEWTILPLLWVTEIPFEWIWLYVYIRKFCFGVILYDVLASCYSLLSVSDSCLQHFFHLPANFSQVARQRKPEGNGDVSVPPWSSLHSRPWVQHCWGRQMSAATWEFVGWIVYWDLPDCKPSCLVWSCVHQTSPLSGANSCRRMYFQCSFVTIHIGCLRERRLQKMDNCWECDTHKCCFYLW